MLDVNRLRVIDAVARHGSVTAAAKELHYSQPSVTHHLARLEAETGAQLLQRVGRGIRLTPAGQLLADRAAEIIGRIDAAGAELSAHVGTDRRPRAPGRLRLRDGIARAGGGGDAGGQASGPGGQPDRRPSTRSDRAAARRQGRGRDHLPLRRDRARAAGVRLHHLLDDPIYLLSTRRERGLATLRDATWIAGCERCRSHLLSDVRRRRVRSADRLQLRRHGRDAGVGGRRARGGDATGSGPARPPDRGRRRDRAAGSERHIYAATYGDPPDPPATAALLEALAEAATAATT